MPNILELARLQVEREGKLNTPGQDLLILDRAIEIRKYFDKIEKAKEKSRFKKLT